MNSSDVDALGLPSHWNTDLLHMFRGSLCGQIELSLPLKYALSYLPAGKRIPVTENKAFPATNRNGPLYPNATKKGQRCR